MKLTRTGLLLALLVVCIPSTSAGNPEWTQADKALMSLLWIGNLPELSPDPGNQYADNPDAARLGHSLFYDRRLSANGRVSCATCHQPNKSFTDGLAHARGIGETKRGAPGLLGIAHSSWFFWDGRADSLWSQALGPLESAVEHGGNRLQYARLIYSEPGYRQRYEKLFGTMPDITDDKRFPAEASPVGGLGALRLWQAMGDDERQAINRIYSNIGKSIAAYERLLMPGPSRFDRFVEQLLSGKKQPSDNATLSPSEQAGLKLFTGKAMCITCHQGPLLTNHEFHNIGTPDPGAKKPDFIPGIIYLFMDKKEPDPGRFQGIQQVRESEFNCLGKYSDAKDGECAELEFANNDYRSTLGAFKVPSLRNVARTAPYMHSGVFKSLAEVLVHYNTAPQAPSGHSELKPLNLSAQELENLAAFLHTLDSPANADPAFLKAPDQESTE